MANCRYLEDNVSGKYNDCMKLSEGVYCMFKNTHKCHLLSSELFINCDFNVGNVGNFSTNQVILQQFFAKIRICNSIRTRFSKVDANRCKNFCYKKPQKYYANANLFLFAFLYTIRN